MPALCYTRTEDPDAWIAYLRENGKKGAFIGFMKRFPNGWGYRLAESQLWNCTTETTKLEAAPLLYAASGKLML